MTDTLMHDTDAELIAGLREFADFLESHPQFTYALQHTRFLMPVDGDELAPLVSQMGGQREKGVSGDYFGVSRFFGGIELYVYAPREAVCERRQVGTRTVEKPVVVGTETVEEPVYEWNCKPVLREATDG